MQVGPINHQQEELWDRRQQQGPDLDARFDSLTAGMEPYASAYRRYFQLIMFASATLMYHRSIHWLFGSVICILDVSYVDSLN